MAVTVPTGFPVVGSNAEGGGVAQYSTGRPIGGGASDANDGQDEALDSLQGINHTWARGRLCIVNQLTAYGSASPQAAIASRTAAGWSGFVLRLPVYLNDSRADLSVTVDYTDGQVEVTAYNTSTDALIATGTTAITATQTQTDLSFAGLPQDAYLKVRIQRQTTEVKLFAIRAFEEPSTP